VSATGAVVLGSPPSDANGISTLDLNVSGDSINWSLDSETQLPEHLHLPKRREQMISLLVDLLQQSTDVELLATDLEKTPGRGGQRMIYGELLMVVGHELFDLLFPQNSSLREKAFERLEWLATGKISRLRIKLCLMDEWLASLPWEYTRTPPEEKFDVEGRFLSQMAELLLSRRLAVEHRDLGATLPVPVLLVCSSPPSDDSLQPVDADPVLEKLEELQRAGYVTLVSLVEGPRPARPNPDWEPCVTGVAFQRAIRDLQPQIVHFVGHGRCSNGAGQLAFSKVDGQTDWVCDKDIKRWLLGSTQLKLVFLQACESALPDPYVSFSGVARTLAAARIPAIIGMQYRVRSSTANAFAQEFYDALLDRTLPISSAVQAGRQKLDEESRGHDFGLPVLYLGTESSFLLPQTTPRPAHMVAIDRHDCANVQECPRCRTQLKQGTRVCTRCRLWLVCRNPKCGEPYDDPINNTWCSWCDEPLNQHPFAEDDVAGGAAEIDAGPARAALSLLRGTGGLT
jgi:hypothetical protein